MLRSLRKIIGSRSTVKSRAFEPQAPEASQAEPRVAESDPFSSAPDRTVGDAEQVNGDPRPIRILVAEDNLVNQKMMLLLLLRMGHSADLAPDGRQAYEMTMQRGYDLILMDLHMPIMGGLEATRLINEYRPGHSKPKIVAVTADTTPEARRACEELGMTAFISKPFDRDKLSAVISKIAA